MLQSHERPQSRRILGALGKSCDGSGIQEGGGVNALFHMNGAWGKDIGVWRQANGTTLRGEGSSSDRMVRESRVRNHVPAEWFLNSVAESRFRLNGFQTGKRNHGPALMVRSKGERNHGSRLMVRSKRKRNHGPGEWCLSKKKRNHGPGSMQKRQKLSIFCHL